MSLEEMEHRLVPKLIAENVRLKDLITELCDALAEKNVWMMKYSPLIERAREAVSKI